ncbi:MAG: MoaD/ThiS family protein [Planctomycetota bacterium]
MNSTSVPCPVRLFGQQARLAGIRAIEVGVSPGVTTCRDVLDRLVEIAPALAPSMPASVLAVNHEVAPATRTLRGDEELALIGLVGGG